VKNLRINREGKIKICLSFLLLFYAITVGIACNNIIIIFAMLFSSVGDVLLLVNRGCFNEKKKETFNYGIIAFSISHMLYIYAMTTSKLSNILIFIALGLIGTLIILVQINCKSKIIIFSLYGIIILLNFINSFNYSIIALVGMFWFVLSDIAVAVSKIRQKRTITSQFIIWITYIFAQICLLSSFLL